MALPKTPGFELGPMAGMGAAGVGLSLLENSTLFHDQPDEIKHINTVLGGATGAVMSHPDTKIKAMALLGWPIKQLGLLGVGKAEQFRQDQSELLDRKMQAAEVELDTAEVNRRAAGGNKALAAAFLIPALVGSGALGYYAWNRRKRENAATGRYGTVEESGQTHGRKRVKIEVPASALPDEFYRSLMNVEDNPLARTRVQEQNVGSRKRASTLNPGDAEAYNKMWKEHWDRPGYGPLPEPAANPSTGRQALSFLGGWTGVPQLLRGAQEMGEAQDAMEEQRPKDLMRYGVAGAANLGMGISAANILAPLAGAGLGRERVRDWLVNHTGKGTVNRHLTSFPTLGSWLYRHAWANKMDPTPRRRGGEVIPTSQDMYRKNKGMDRRGPVDRARDIKFRYDPDRFAFDQDAVTAKYDNLNAQRRTAHLKETADRLAKGLTARPAPELLKRPETLGIVKHLLSASKKTPSSFWGSAFQGSRYAANRGLNAAYRATMLARRNPNAALFLGALPFAGMGLERDQQHHDNAQAMLREALPDYQNFKGYGGTSISGTLSNLLNTVGANHEPGIARELR